jgi:hypothetical protein
MKLMAGLIIFLASIGIRAEDFQPAQWRESGEVIRMTRAEQELETNQLLSCEHLQQRLDQRNTDENRVADDIKSFNYYFSQLHLQEDHIATRDSYKVEWQLPLTEVKRLGLNNAQAFAVLGPANFELSNLQDGFKSARREIKKSKEGWIFSAEVRGVDICWQKRLILVALTHCPIDRTHFEGCQGDECLQPEPVIFWRRCQGEIHSLDLNGLISSLGRSSGIIGRRQGGKP